MSKTFRDVVTHENDGWIVGYREVTDDACGSAPWWNKVPNSDWAKAKIVPVGTTDADVSFPSPDWKNGSINL